MPWTKKEQKEYNREYSQNPINKQKRKEYDESDKGKKSNMAGNWKHQGLVVTSEEELDEIYDRYLASERCEKCNKKYTEKNRKCMDHEHLNGKFGAFRNILCNACNLNDKSSNTSGTPNISKYVNGWVYKKTTNKIKHQKYFKTKEEAIDYKIQYESIQYIKN